MRRRLLYHASAVNPNPDPTPDPEVTVTGYELGISEFSYPTVKHSDTSVSPVFRYYYIPKYSDGTEGERVYITQEDETPDFLYVKFTLNSEYDANVREAETELDEKTGVLTFNEWSDYINNIGGYRVVAVVDMHVGYAPNGSDRAYADFPEVAAEQSSVDIYWHTPIVTLSYDDAPAQPDEEGGKIILKPTVKWTQEGYDDDGNIHIDTSDDAHNAQYVFSSTGDISVDVDGNVTVPSSTVEERHNVGTVTVKVTNEQVIDGEEQAGSDTCNIYQEAYTPIPEEATLGIDVLLFDEDTRDNIIVPKGDFDYSKYPKSQYTPIGLVVIPREHGVYGDKNTIGVLSLMDADLSNPAEGGTHGNTIYGMFSKQSSDGYIPYNVKDSTINDEIIGSNLEWAEFIVTGDILFPSDMYSGLKNTLDEETSYKNSSVNYGFTSPYNNNGGANSLYIADADDGGYKYPSVFQDFNGEQKSINLLHNYNYQVDDDLAHLYGTVKDDSVWRTSSKISFTDNDDFDTSYVENYSVLPAMEACWRYSPENTHEGNWHLPSAGEWGYVMARAKAINNTLATLKDLYGINYSDISDYDYINATLENGAEFIMWNDSYNVAVGYSDGGFAPIVTNKKGIARPMMRLKATATSGSIGNTPLPTGYDSIDANNFLDDNRHKSRWCIYRNENACNDAYYPSNSCKAGTVYGVLVKSDTDMTILKTDVELFSFDNLTCASGRLNRQFGYYNQDIEAGWYVIQKIVWSDGTSTWNIYPNSVYVGNKLQPIAVSQDGWQGTISIVYNYRNESNLGYDDYTYQARNSVLSPFRIGYWDHTTAILLHSTQDTTNTAPAIYSDGKGDGYGIPTDEFASPLAYMTVPAKTIGPSDDSLSTLVEEPYYQYTVAVGEPMILADGDTITVNHSGNVNSSYPVSGAYYIALMLHEMNGNYSDTQLAITYSDNIVNLFSNGDVTRTIQIMSRFGSSGGADKSKSRFRLYLYVCLSNSGDFTISNDCTIYMGKS